MTDLSHFQRVTAKQFYEDYASNDSLAAYLLTNVKLRAISLITPHGIGTTYIGGGYDIYLENDEWPGFIDPFTDVYMTKADKSDPVLTDKSRQSAGVDK